jgi:cell fate regulator YaaT (PSP1 superfamily)
MVSAHYSMDDSMIYITFLSENRVDFRDLVKQVAQKFQKKIHLQQIGPRDKAKIKGGLALCGQEFCCKKFLTELPSVTMEAVRVQNMAYKGTDKLSGQCGKLMCCLNYESSQYRELIDKFPKFGNIVKYQGRKGVVTGLDVLNEKLKIKFEDHKIESVNLNDLDK